MCDRPPPLLLLPLLPLLLLQLLLCLLQLPWRCPAPRSALPCPPAAPPPPCLAGLVRACLPPLQMPRSRLPSAPTAAQALLGIPALPHQRCGCHHSGVIGDCGLLQSGEDLVVWRGSGGPKSPRARGRWARAGLAAATHLGPLPTVAGCLGMVWRLHTHTLLLPYGASQVTCLPRPGCASQQLPLVVDS